MSDSGKPAKLEALVIGCGAIGAGYDLHSDAVLTHAKALHLNPRTRLTVTDADPDRAKSVAEVYDAAWIASPTHADFQKFDIVSICIPTALHFPCLQSLMQADLPVILCEKPVAGTLTEIDSLRQLQRSSRSRILVNYIRRFQPAFCVLKRRLRELRNADQVRDITVRYQRGFLNNCGHALDLLEFLFDRPVLQHRLHIVGLEYDAFESDPTISGAFAYEGAAVFLSGFVNSPRAVFEIDIEAAGWRIELRESGNDIRFYSGGAPSIRRFHENTEWHQADAIKNYMVPVLDYALDVFDRDAPTNFASALDLNESMLKALSSH